tara:strand:- start:463 stop:1128 length:666 start_codon:yes stop_codon:yes gene_type:complete
MIRNKKLLAIVAVRAGSQRVKNKNLKKFAGTNLLKIKLKKLIKIKDIDEILVSSDSSEMLRIAKKLNLTTHKRKKYYASSKATNSEFFKNLAENIDADYVLYSPVTTPLISKKTIQNCINVLKRKKLNFKSVATVKLVKHHMWLNNKPLNYKVNKSPSSQDLPNIMAITYGCCIIKRSDMLKFKNVVTDKSKFIVLNDIEATDIDNELDFKIAEYLYKNKN